MPGVCRLRSQVSGAGDHLFGVLWRGAQNQEVGARARDVCIAPTQRQQTGGHWSLWRSISESFREAR